MAFVTLCATSFASFCLLPLPSSPLLAPTSTSSRHRPDIIPTSPTSLHRHIFTHPYSRYIPELPLLHLLLPDLNSLPEGTGHTEFPSLGLSVTPRRGDALLFCNVDEHGDADPRTIHRACPVSGEHRKFGVNIWLSDGDWSDFALDGNAKKTAKKKKKKKTTTTTKVTTASAAVGKGTQGGPGGPGGGRKRPRKAPMSLIDRFHVPHPDEPPLETDFAKEEGGVGGVGAGMSGVSGKKTEGKGKAGKGGEGKEQEGGKMGKGKKVKKEVKKKDETKRSVKRKGAKQKKDAQNNASSALPDWAAGLDTGEVVAVRVAQGDRGVEGPYWLARIKAPPVVASSKISRSSGFIVPGCLAVLGQWFQCVRSVAAPVDGHCEGGDVGGGGSDGGGGGGRVYEALGDEEYMRVDDLVPRRGIVLTAQGQGGEGTASGGEGSSGGTSLFLLDQIAHDAIQRDI